MRCQCPDHDCLELAGPSHTIPTSGPGPYKHLCRACYIHGHGWQWELRVRQTVSRQREPWPDEDFEDDDTVWIDSQALIDHQTSEERWEGRA